VGTSHPSRREVAGKLVGRVSIRHELNAYLAELGGHIGYAVRPEFRRRGYATGILRQSLLVAQELGIDQALVTCDDENAGSARVIERCGGVLADVVPGPDGSAPKRRYWARRARQRGAGSATGLCWGK
jgi:predicted acetyltransferase